MPISGQAMLRNKALFHRWSLIVRAEVIVFYEIIFETAVFQNVRGTLTTARLG